MIGGPNLLLRPESAALVAGLVLVCIDWFLLHRGPSAAPVQLYAISASTILFAAGLAALAVRLSLRVTDHWRRRPWQRSLAGATIFLVVIVPVSVMLFRGTGISARWYAPYGPFVVTPLLFGLTALGLRLWEGMMRWIGQRGPGVRLAVTIPLSALAGLLVWADRSLYPNQYHYLHWVLLLLSSMLLMGVGWFVVPHVGTRCPRLRWVAPALLALATISTLATSKLTLESHRLRQIFSVHTHTGGRLVDIGRGLFDLDGDHHSIIFGEHDCDNQNPAVHPFALDVPGNNVDEDCDGRDDRPPSPSRRPQIHDMAAYHKALRVWKQRPPLAALLRATAHHSVVLVVLDALRADQVTPSRANRDNHPNLMRFLDHSRHFTRAFATGAGTDICMATIFTGMLNPFLQTDQTLLGAFQRAGVFTYGVFQREVQRWVGRQFSLEGLSGRKVVINDPGRRDLGSRATSEQVTDHAIAFLKDHVDRRFFLWLHYFDIHEHHQVDLSTLDKRPDPERSPERGLPFYRLMIQHVDRHLGRLLDAIEDLGLRHRVIVVVLGDHGEGLAQSPRLPIYHGDVLFNPLIHVPLALRIPGVTPAKLHVPVSLADLLPTLLDLAGIDRQPTDGVSLVPYLFGVQQRSLEDLVRPLFMVETRQRGVILWPWKLLAWLDQGLVELYNLEHDYLEENNRADDLKVVVKQLSRVLGSRELPVIDRLRPKTGPLQ